MSKRADYIYGYHTVAQVLDSRPDSILEVCFVKEKKLSRRLQAILDQCRARSVTIQAISSAQINRLTGSTRHQGILARTRMANVNTSIQQLCDAAITQTSLLLALDGLQDSHNLGACIRTANAAGVEAVILTRDNSAPVNASVRKVACGAVETMNMIVVTNLSRALKQLKEAGYWVAGADEKASMSLFDFLPEQPLVMVMGAEGSGLRHNTRQQCDYLVRIPMLGEVASLNVSVATGVCLYQLRSRQAVMRACP